MKKSLVIGLSLLATAAAVHAEELFVNIRSGSATQEGCAARAQVPPTQLAEGDPQAVALG